MSMQEIWHCPSEPGRQLAETLVKSLPTHIWSQFAQHFDKPYPYTMADKYYLVYRFLGCKTEVSTN